MHFKVKVGVNLAVAAGIWIQGLDPGMPLHGIVSGMSRNMGEEPGHARFRVRVGELRGLVQVDYLPTPFSTMLPPSVTIPNSERDAEKCYGYQVEHGQSESRERYPCIRRLDWLLHAG